MILKIYTSTCIQKMRELTFFVLLVHILATISSKLPSSFTQCDQKSANFDECLTKSVENAITQLTKPIPEVALPSLAPLEIPSLVIGAGTGPVGLAQNYKNVKVSGFTDITCSKAHLDFEKKILDMDCFLPEIRMDFEYEVNGKILLLPVYGTGPGTITMERVKYLLTFHLEEFEKKGKKHFKVTDSKLIMEPQLIKFNFENLFNGDKALGDNINTVINENWKELFEDVGQSYEEAFGQIFGAIFNNILSKVAISDMFSNVE